MGGMDAYKDIDYSTRIFFESSFRPRVKEEEKFQKIRDAYNKLNKNGKSEFGYVNLYDVKKSFKLSYESFNTLLNNYYATHRYDEIILFSNTVASIDRRKRFIVAGQVALKMRIIKKSTI